jgi:hypothetical protein
MVDLRNYMHPELATGREVGIEVKMMLWLNAGTGRVEVLEAALVAVKGVFQVMGKERELEVQLVLGDDAADEEGRPTGPCTLRIGDEADGEGVYRVEGESLVLLGKIKDTATRVTLSRNERHSLIDIEGDNRLRLRLTPG